VVIEVRGARTLRGSRLEGLLSWTAPRDGKRLDLSSVIVAIVNVTDSRIANEQLRELVKSRDDLVATVSHELRTPLTTVVGLAAELCESQRNFSPAETQELVQLISDQSEEVAMIVDDLLAAARAETRSLTVVNQPVDLATEVRGTLNGLGVVDTVEHQIDPNLGPVTGDPGRIRQIVRNLLVNAQKYGGPQRKVIVRRDGLRGKIEVRDDGEALAEPEQMAVFERYYRAHQTEGVTGSIGLGLAVSRELARTMGGDLTYHHDGEAVFTLSLPLSSLAADVSLAASTPT
jgi:two-component system CheB/CheR fusion protein